MKLTGFEMDVIVNILSNPANGGTIKDLRLIDRTIKLMKNNRPEIPAELDALPADATEEEKKAHAEEVAAWEKNLNEIQNTDIEIEVGDIYFGLIKARLSSFNNFNNHEQIRPKIFALAEKFGL